MYPLPGPDSPQYDTEKPDDPHPIDCGDKYCELCGEDAPW